MYKRRSFFEYVNRYDLIEMAQLKKEDAVQFDKYDFEYLKQFSPKNSKPPFPESVRKNIWMYAIMYRYSPTVLMHPDVEQHTFTIEAGAQGEKQGKYVFSGIRTYTKELIAKLEDRYDIDKINLRGAEGAKAATSTGRVMARKAAERAIAYLQDPSGPIPALHINIALSAERKSGRRKNELPLSTMDRSLNAPVGEREFVKHDVTLREPITLDDDDRKFLAWFAAHPEYPKLKALQMRYSGGQHGLINDPQADRINYPGTEPGQIYKRIQFPGLPDAEMVPVNAQRLKKRLEVLRDKHGVDVWKNPLSNASAKGWITKGTWKPWLGQSGKKDDSSAFTKKFSSINKWIEEQDMFLQGKRDEPPGQFDRGLKDFNIKVPWMDILKQEAEWVAKRELRRAESKGMKAIQMDFDVESLMADAWEWLASEKAASNPEYASQDWRLKNAGFYARDQITIRRNQQKGDRMKDLSGERRHAAGTSKHGPGREEEDEPIIPGEEKDVKRFGATKDQDSSADGGGGSNAIIDLLKAEPTSQNLPNDTDWEALAQDFIQALEKWQDGHRHRELNHNDYMMVAKDVIAPHVPAMAAAKHPTHIPKTDEPTAPPKAVSYGGKGDEGDEEDLAKYRRRRF